MRKAILSLTALVLATATWAFAGSTVVQEIVARVNNAIITRSDYQRAKDQRLQELKQQMPEAQAQQQFAKEDKDTLRSLIDQQLLVQKGEDLGIKVDNELLKQLDDMRKQMGLATIEEQSPNQTSLEAAAREQGVSWEDFKAARKNELLMNRVVQSEVASHITITPEEMQKFYDEHKKELDRPESVSLSEILVSTEPKEAKDAQGNVQRVERTPEEVAAAEKKAHDLLEQIKKGAKFEDVAQKNSDGPTASQGGDIGEFERGKLAKELEDLTFNMKPGTVSDVIRTKQGFVILRVDGHHPPGVPPLKDVEPQIQNAIMSEKLQPVLRAYLTKLREDAYIDIRQGYVDTGASPNETKPVETTAAQPGAKEKLKRKKKFGIF